MDCFFGGLNKSGWKKVLPANIIADKNYNKNLGEYAKLKSALESEFESAQCASLYKAKYGKKPTTKKISTTTKLQ